MSKERRIPDWAEGERQSDLAWIRDNLHVFTPVANEAFQQYGRGALVVDTTVQPIPGGGHPFGFYTQEQVEAYDDEDIKRLVRQYNPRAEFVVVMLKEEGKMSSYRIRVFRPGLQPIPRRR